MRIVFTCDVEVWCPRWSDIDETFPSAFRRMIGSNADGQWGLSRTLGTLRRHGLRATFFVESLFAARFGVHYLREIVDAIAEDGHEIQLHVHPEWADEIDGDWGHKRHSLALYTREEQARLIRLALELMREVGVRPAAFRAGNMAVNRDTFRALADNDLLIDSSIDATLTPAAAQLDPYRPAYIENVASHPIAVFRDGLGLQRHAQVGACSLSELVQAIEACASAGAAEFVMFTHNFETQMRNSHLPNRIVVDRLDGIAAYLARHQDRHPVVAMPELREPTRDAHAELQSVGTLATLKRNYEQAVQRLPWLT